MRFRAAGVALLCVLLAACVTAPPAPERKTPRRLPPPPQQIVPKVSRTPGLSPEYVPGPAPLSERDRGPAPEEIPEGIELTPDAIPQDEPRSRSGNSPEYQVFGKTYRTMAKVGSSFRERGHASWYGKKFHGRKTANGELYDMFKMTAAHKTLPLPSYVRVTNLSNGKTTVVRVNDRGPFHKGRIIDLSYAAAAKLELINHGAVEVEIEVVTADSPPPTVVAAAAPEVGGCAPAKGRDPPRAGVHAGLAAGGQLHRPDQRRGAARGTARQGLCRCHGDHHRPRRRNPASRGQRPVP